MDINSFKEYDKLIYKIAKYFHYPNKEDLYQAGSLGLLKAYKNYDNTLGVKFSTYAYSYIYGEMYDLCLKDRSVYLNKDAIRVYKSIKKTKELLNNKYNRDVSIDEVIRYLGLDINKVYPILCFLNNSISLDEANISIPYYDKKEDLILLKESLLSLSGIERDIIKYRYFNDNTQEETAKILGLSQVKVSRIEKRSKEKIKEFISV